MKQILTVFKFTFREAAKKKAFIITTVIIMALVLIMCFIPRIVDSFKGDNKKQAADKTWYYKDLTQLIPGAKELLSATYANIEFVDGDPSQEAVYRDEIKEDANKTMIIISEENGATAIKVVSKNFLSSV